MTAYPAALDTADELFQPVNTFYALVQSACSSVDVSIVLTSHAGLQATGGIIAIGSELIKYATINTGGVYPILETCTRGFGGTAAVAHQANEVVELRWVAEHHTVVATAVRALEVALGLNPATDSVNSVTFTDLVDRLMRNLPKQVSFVAVDPWVFTHDRRRAVTVQCYQDIGSGNYRLIAPTQLDQNINPAGLSTVTINFGVNKTGYAIYA